MNRQKLTKRETAFCREYVFSGNIRESAKKAGYTIMPEAVGIRLFSDSRIKDEITSVEKKLSASKTEALKGYRRLAFGEIGDAIKLIEGDENALNNIELLDLFMVSEIKKPKGGGMEIKFFDRQKALERIEALSESEDSEGALSFYRALENSASKSKKDKDGSNDDK